MKISLAIQPSKSGDLIRFFTKEDNIPAEFSKQEFSAARFSTALLRKEKSRTLCVGLGEKKKITPNTLRKATGTAVREMERIGATRLAIDLSKLERHIETVVIGALCAQYRYEEFLPEKSRRKSKIESLLLIADAKKNPNLREQIQTAEKIAKAINLARAIGNRPPNIISPATLATSIQNQISSKNYRVRVWNKKALQRDGFRAILAVGAGSANEPRFITLEPVRKISAPTVAIVGKAVTFDSGGLSLKPAASMEDMKFDKLGGCAAFGIAHAVAALGLPVNLHVAIPSAENIPGEGAYRPGDLLHTWDDQTIEVLNTDAEGRVILADALAYACKTWKPDIVINLATLTGACVVALGEERAGLFSNDDELSEALYKAGETTGDRVWRLPQGEEYDGLIKSDVALVKNTGGRWGGACSAATFLSHWITAPQWAHLDIAGPAQTHKASRWLEAGATGFGIALVVNYLRSLTNTLK
ncbi:MAG: leucyl aminopeptidase [Chthoniobacterales bacterium]